MRTFVHVLLPAREPRIGALTVDDTTPGELSTAEPDGGAPSAGAWILIVPSGGAGIRLGDESVTAITGLPVAAGEQFTIPSSRLAGWFVVAESGSVTVRVLGAGDV
jgi:hypothetical protein